MNKRRHIKKESLLKALETTLGVVTVACKKADVPRSTYYKWLNEDEAFAKEVKDIENIALDFAESQLHKQIGDGNTACTIFYLKTKGRKRGYIERVENVNVQKEAFSEFTDEQLQDKINKLNNDVKE